MTKRASILIVEDEAVFLESLAVFFRRADFDVGCASTGGQAWELFTARNWDVVALDMVLPDRDGIELMRGMIEEQLFTPIILMTGFGTVETAIEATRVGAFDYVTKPFRPSKLGATVEVALAYKKLYELLSLGLKKGLRTLLQSTLDRTAFNIGREGEVQLSSSLEIDNFLEKTIAVVGQSFVRSFPLVAGDITRELHKQS